MPIRNMQLQRIDAQLTKIATGLNVGSALLILGLIALINADVASRSLLDFPLRGVTEVVSLSIQALVFLSVAYLAATQKLIRADLLLIKVFKIAPMSGAALQTIFHLIAVALMLTITFATWPSLVEAFRLDEFIGVEGDFTLQVWPLKLVIVIGAGLVAIISGVGAVTTVAKFISSTEQAVSWRQRLLGPMLVITLSAGLIAGVGGGDARTTVGILAIASMFIWIYAGLPVAFALMLAAVLGIGAIKHDYGIAADALGLVAEGAVSYYVFAAVPLFVFMGMVVGSADIGRDSLQAAHWVLRRVKGGLGLATVAANAVFAAITGISIASASIFSQVAVPPLIEHGYTPRFAVGLVAGTSVLGMLIPPSLLLIIYGIVAEVSINRLFLAAIVPGLVLAAAYGVMVFAVAIWRPKFAVRAGAHEAEMTLDAWGALRKMLPIAGLIMIVLGGIYGGVFTPTEAGAVGALAATGLALAMRRVSGQKLLTLLTAAAATSASILFLILAASAFAIMLTLSGIPSYLGATIAAAGFDLTGYAVVYVLLLVLLGMVLDSTSILLIMVPLALPAVVALGGDLVWFGIITVIGVEIGLLTPPLGLSVYTIKSALEDQSITLNDIFIGAMPFALIMFAVTLLLIFVPSLSLGILG